MSSVHHSLVGGAEAARSHTSLVATGDTPPTKKTLSNSKPYAAAPNPKQEETNKDLGTEMRGHFVGPMPVQEFLDEFMSLPEDGGQCPTVPSTLFHSVMGEGVNNESAMYNPFIQAVADYVPNMHVVNTSGRADKGTFPLKPDLCLYLKSADDPEPTGTNFRTMEMWIEFKFERGSAPFTDPTEKFLNRHKKENMTRESFIENRLFETEGDDALIKRGQLTSYARAHHGEQFRRFSFSVAIRGKHARLIRWECAGAVVTAEFNYHSNPEHLAQFFWRFSQLSKEKRGHDISVSPATLSEDEQAQIRQALELRKPWTKHETTEIPKGGNPPLPESPVELFRYQVPNGQGTMVEFYGPRPPSIPHSLIGRRTSGFPVYELEEKRAVYLKNTWRVHSPDFEPEGETYRTLHLAQTPHIPDCLYAGDIPGEGTITVAQTLTQRAWSCVRDEITGYAQYRLILLQIGKSLREFKRTKELVQAVLDATRAHAHALDKAQILHRDVSAGNIIRTGAGGGLLIDWEFAKRVDVKGERRPQRTGTWQFISAWLLQYPGSPHELKDDLESFLHVLTWATIRYVPTDMKPSDRLSHLALVYDRAFAEDSCTGGGDVKARYLEGGTYIPRKWHLKRPSPLLALLRTLSGVFGPRYKEPTIEERQEFEELKQEISDRQRTGERFDDAAIAKVYKRNAVYELEVSTKRLENSEWFTNTIAKSLEDDTTWPADDAADPNLLPDSLLRSRNLTRRSRIETMQSQAPNSSAASVISGSSKHGRDPSPTPASRGQSKRPRVDTPLGSGSHN